MQGPSNYAFGYSVKDDYSGDDFSHNEVRDGYKTEGEYRVALPDGRVQIVSYVADENGYHADVRKSVTIRAHKTQLNVFSSSQVSIKFLLSAKLDSLHLPRHFEHFWGRRVINSSNSSNLAILGEEGSQFIQN